MTIVKQTTGEYRIDLDSTIKSTYNSSTLVKIDNVTVGTALPYTGSLSIGIHDIYLELTGSTISKLGSKESSCESIDP